MIDKELKIQTAGVFRCCLASVGVDKDTNEVIDAKDGDTSRCWYCDRKFTLVDRTWEPSDWRK